MTPRRPVERFDARRHRLDEFACGISQLDRWLRAYAGQAQRSDAARTYVTTDSERRVVGYYTLVATEIEHSAATSEVERGQSKHFPIPAVLIARLAVTEVWQGKGVGRSLLLDAFSRIAAAAQQIGIRAVVVHATNETAARFYGAYGLIPAAKHGLTLMTPMAAVRTALAGHE